MNDDSDPSTFDEAVIQAIDDAYADGVDIAVLALGAPALWGAADYGSTCGNPNANDPCDPVAAAVEAAVQGGMLVVAAAGNDGGAGYYYPTYGAVNSPATAPSAIAVGATTNSHFFVSTVYTLGNAPSAIQAIDAQLSNGLKFSAPFTAPVADAGGTACAALAPGSMTGAIALIQRGDCAFFYKLYFAQQAGRGGGHHFPARRLRRPVPAGRDCHVWHAGSIDWQHRGTGFAELCAEESRRAG